MLNLNPCIHFKEVEGTIRGEEKLQRTRTTVIEFGGDLGCRR